ncbi:MAG: helix-turn-helix transcriptional regulator [Chloroherpetonaceae bacterium]|nr:helix-turn-helix transcriptional regulator [Chloroherpetonaceae bacterium]MCS7210984.1 helix-turn-helix transcriptional regulator [Chloroherpetonaceae bacterium]MDW8020819.1 helix-turn-helix transcriptional regulator [Chloroherpetonaceae bacterium]MDW8466799.1 helix-turn-helix transcriptional regulator [Chloroherpetonaceae bacterium]
MTKFGEILRAKKLKIAQVSELTGLSESYLNELVNRSVENLTVKEAVALAHAVEMSADEFMKQVKPSLIKTPPPLRSQAAQQSGTDETPRRPQSLSNRA